MMSEAGTKFVGEFLRVTGQVIEQIGGKAPKVELDQVVPDSLKCRVDVALRMDPKVRADVEFGETENQFFAQLLVGEPVADETERRSAVEELWRQIVGRATTELRPLLKGQDLDVVSEADQSWEPSLNVGARLVFSGASPALTLAVRLSPEAMQFLGSGESDRVKTAIPPSGESQNLEMLLDVPLSVTLRFGERRLPLREILQMSSGAVIELDRRADEPVELFLDERVIARGNVVVVDGCYGLRVTEVCNHQSTHFRSDLHS